MSNEFASKYRRAFESIYGRPPKRSEGVATRAIVAAEKRLGRRLPEALRAFYSTVGGTRLVTAAHNQITSPEELSADAGYIRFCDENQSVCDWWVPLDRGHDPTVTQRVAGESHEVATCSEFLHYLLHMQALMGGLEYGGARDEDVKVVAETKQEWDLACDQEGLAIYRRGGMLIGCPAGSDLLFAAARTEEDREWLEKHFQFEF